MSKSLNEKYNSKRFNLNINKDLEKLNTHLELLNNLYNFNSTPDKTGYINKDYLIQEDILKVYRNKIEFLKNNIKNPIMSASGLSKVTCPMAITCGASAVGVGSEINKLDNLLSMVAITRALKESLVNMLIPQKIH